MGIPAPGETILLLAAAAAATGTGNIFLVIASAAFGAILGDNIAFFLGRRYGRPILARIAHLDDAKLARSEAFFEKYGAKTIFIARFVPLVRMVAAYLAGINNMRTSTFMFYNMSGGITWAVIMGSLGFFFGRNLALLELWLRRFGGIVVAILLLAVFLFWLNRRWQRNERAYYWGRIGLLAAFFQSIWQRVAARGQRGVLLYGLLLILGSLSAGLLIGDVVNQEPELYRRDILATIWLRIGTRDVPQWVEGLAYAGDVRVLGGLTAITAASLWWQRQRRLSLLTLFNFVGALVSGWGIQLWIRRPLPPSAEPLWHLTAFTFPNMASLLAVVVYGWLIYLWGRSHSWSSQLNIGTAATFLILSISLANLFLGEGYLTDVLVGLLLGFLWLGIPLILANNTALTPKLVQLTNESNTGI